MGDHRYIFNSSRDITARKNDEFELQRYKEELERLVDARLGQLLGTEFAL